MFKQGGEMKLVSNYLEKQNKNGYFMIKKNSKSDQAKVGRMDHLPHERTIRFVALSGGKSRILFVLHIATTFVFFQQAQLREASLQIDFVARP